MPEDNIDIQTYTDGHAFSNERPEEILRFLWSTLEYGELKEPDNW